MWFLYCGNNKLFRQRRSSGSSSAAGVRMKSSRTFPISNAFLVTNATKCPHFLSAAEDTSAKESSAGETEFEDCHPVYNLPPLHNAGIDDTENNTACINGIKSHKLKGQHVPSFSNDTFSLNGAVSSLTTKHTCLRRDCTKGKQIQVLSSSCSDLEPDSSVLVSSDYDAAPNSDKDQEEVNSSVCTILRV